jgi:hypothetical protein
MKQVEIGTTDGAAGDLDNGIPRILDPRISHRIAADIFFAMPNQGSHRSSPSICIEVEFVPEAKVALRREKGAASLQGPAGKITEQLNETAEAKLHVVGVVLAA